MKIALGVTGCIAAYKAVEVMRMLQKAGVSVHVILTRAAARFVGPLTFESLSGHPVVVGMFNPGSNVQIEHIRLAQDVGLFAVVPATANILGKFARGIADDFLSTFYLSCPAPVVIAPAMNVVMWNHPAVRKNVKILKSRGHRILEPEAGTLACGMEGEGRLAAVDDIVRQILSSLSARQSMAGLKVLITAGPTIEDIDPVRYLSNRSSGKMGYALAQAALDRGADVILVSGPTQLVPPPGARMVRVRSAAEMKDAVLREFSAANIVIKAAAVSDFRPVSIAPRKIKKANASREIVLVPTEDILGVLGRLKTTQVLVGFAAETENLLENARGKMSGKNLDMIVANDVGAGVFGSDSASVHILGTDGTVVRIDQSLKAEIADRIVEKAASLCRSIQQSAAAPGTSAS